MASLPKSIAHITFHPKSTIFPKVLIFHENIKNLVFGDYFNSPLILPSSLKKLVLGKNFIIDKCEDLILPLGLTHLSINRLFRNSDETLIVPPTVTHLSLNGFNSEIFLVNQVALISYSYHGWLDDNIDFYPRNSQTLTHLDITLHQNMDFTSLLNLINLKIQTNHSYTNPHDLPSSIRHLTIKTNHRGSFVISSYPPNLSYLLYDSIVHGNRICSLDERLPSSLITLIAHGGRLERKIDFPPKLRHIDLFDYTHTLDNLPSTLLSLKLRGVHHRKLDLSYLPNLTFVSAFKGYTHSSSPYEFVPPPSISTLKLGGFFTASLDNPPLPSSLLHLKIGNGFNRSLRKLPQGLETLKIGNSFNYDVEFLPKSLKSLIFTQYSIFSYPVDNLPPNLQVLVLGNRFNQEINNLPSGLKKLVLGYKFHHELHCLPRSLISLKLGSNLTSDRTHLSWIKNLIIPENIIAPFDNPYKVWLDWEYAAPLLVPIVVVTGIWVVADMFGIEGIFKAIKS